LILLLLSVKLSMQCDHMSVVVQ